MGDNSCWDKAVIMKGSGSGGGEDQGGGKKVLLHLHLAVGSRAVLVQHRPETYGNKAFIGLSSGFTGSLTSPGTSPLDDNQMTPAYQKST